jgi:hypothetical protein
MWSKTVEERGRDALCQGEGSWEEVSFLCTETKKYNRTVPRLLQAQNPPSAFARRVQNKRPILPKDSLVGAWRWEGPKLGAAGCQRVHGRGEPIPALSQDADNNGGCLACPFFPP